VDQIKKQSWKLLNLVNQILDLTKIDSKVIQSHFIQADVMQFLRYLIDSFNSRAESKGLDLYTNLHLEKLVMDFDPEKLEAIVTNLIANAIKFTPESGSITVETNQQVEGYLQIIVTDTGIGIKKENLEKIFKRFYQIAADKYQEGNGVGLTIVNEYVNLLGGNIEVTSKLGSGTTFRISLPIKNEAPLENTAFKASDEDRIISEVVKSDDFSDHALPLLLIIDDHKDIVDYLKKMLLSQYRIIEASNGKQGYQKAIEFIPDIIISDVMMPEMDGFELLKKIKSEWRTSHIPVLMLTAKVDRTSKLEGLELGAEAYLVKPFDKEELFIRLRKLLNLRQTLHDKYQHINLGVNHLQESGSLEDQFMSKVRKVIEEHLDDESFNIKKLCRELGMSHTQLYRKFSALTDITVNKYIRQFRLHKAMNLLKSSDLNISQIALEVGLPNLAYFSRIFTEEFKINPSKVRQSETPIERNGE
jgi:DNA-binding response OmpR family regulator/two-component sensor histidine kinase